MTCVAMLASLAVCAKGRATKQPSIFPGYKSMESEVKRVACPPSSFPFVLRPPMMEPPTRRRQHRQGLPRSTSEPAAKLSAVAGAGRHNQLSASLPASFAQNDRRHHLSDLLNAEEVKEHLQRFPGCQYAAYDARACRMPALSALIAAAAILWFSGAGPGNIGSGIRKNAAQSTDSDDTIHVPTSRRTSIHNISMPLNLETDNATEARILEEDRRNDMHMRRKRIFYNPEQRDKMIAERKKVKALLEKQNMPIQGRRKKGVKTKTPT